MQISVNQSYRSGILIRHPQNCHITGMRVDREGGSMVEPPATLFPPHPLLIQFRAQAAVPQWTRDLLAIVGFLVQTSIAAMGK